VSDLVSLSVFEDFASLVVSFLSCCGVVGGFSGVGFFLVGLSNSGILSVLSCY